MALMRFTARQTRGGGSVLMDALIDAARPVIRRAADQTGKQAQDNIVAGIKSTYGKRRGKPRSEPLTTKGNYAYRVNTSRRGAQLTFRVTGSADFKAKFGALNFGSGPHVIAPINAPWLANPQDDFFSKTPVMWTIRNPGLWGRHFYEEGIQQALDQFPTLLD